MNQEDDKPSAAARSLSRLTDACALLVLLIGALTTADSLLPVSSLPLPSSLPFNAALGFALAAVGLLAARRRAARFTLVCATILMLIGGLTLLQYVGRIDLGIDTLIASRPPEPHAYYPGRMAPLTAFGLTILAPALVWLLPRHDVIRPGAFPAAAGILLLVLGAIVLGSHATGIDIDHEYLPDVSLLGAVSLLLLGVAIAAAGRELAGAAAPEALQFRDHLLVLVLVLAGMTSWHYASDYQRRALHEALIQDLDQLAQSLQEAMGYRLEALARQAERQAWPHEEQEDELQRWRDDANQYLRDFRTMVTLAWFDAGGELLAQVDQVPAYRVALPRLDTLDGSGELLSQADARRRPLVSVLPDFPGERLFLAVAPAYRDGELHGFSAAVMRPDRVLELALAGVDDPIALQVRDAGGNPVYTFAASADPSTDVAREVNLHGAILHLVVGPVAATLRDYRTALPAWLLGGGLLIALLVALLLRAGRHARHLQNQAEIAYRHLRREADERSRLQAHIRERNRELEQALTTIRNIMDHSLDVICTVNAGGEFVDVSRASEAVWGYRPEELRGRQYRELVHPDDIEKDRAAFADLFSEGVLTDFENRYVHRDGRIVYMLWSAVWSEETQRVYATGRDITAYKQAREELEKSHDRLLEAQRIAHLGYWELDIPRNRLSWSDEVYRIFGLGPEEFGETYEAFRRCVHPDDLTGLEAAQKRALAGEASLDVVHRIIRPDGEVRWVHERGELIRDENELPLRLSGTVQDVTELRRMQAELEASEQRYRQLFDQSPQPLLLFSTEDYRFLAVNDAALAQYGYTREEFLQLSVLDIIPPEDIDATRAAIAGADNYKHQSLGRHRRRDGSPLTVEISSHATEIDGRPARLALVQDVTEREAARTLLERRRRQFHDLATAAVEIHRQLQLEATLQLVAEKAREIIGAHQAVASFTEDRDWTQSIQGLSLSDKYAQYRDYDEPPDGSGIYALVCETNRPMRLTQAELEAHPRWRGFGRHAGEHPPMRGWLAVPLVDSAGNNLGLIQLSDKYEGEFDAQDEAILVQLAQMAAAAVEKNRLLEQVRRQASELEERVRERTAELRAVNQELESFTYSVSHDLRAPLRHMASFAQLLHRRVYDGLDDKSRHYFDIIEDSARRMGELIDDLLSFAHAGRKAMELEIVDMDALVAESLAGLDSEAAGREIEWDIGPLGRVRADPGLLRLVWDNLLSNALKFTRTREIARIEVGRSEGEEGEAVFFVRDNGVGFDMHYADKLFQVFQRLHTRDEFEGTGIGLANVQRIVHRHGGRVWAESEVDRGACFCFTLPSLADKEE